MKRFAWLCATSAFLVLPAAAQAYDGFVIANVNLRAGPDVGYPAITVLPAGAPVSIEGCVDGWTWCDVVVGPDRGWVAGTYLQNVYGGDRVIVTDYGARIGIPIVAFTLGAYWDHYYRARPWYHDRGHWEHYTYAHRPPPRPHGYNAHYGGHGYAHGPSHGPVHNNPHGPDHGHGNDASHHDHGSPGHEADHGHAPAPAHSAQHPHAPPQHHAAPPAHHDDHHDHDHDHDHH